MEEKEATSVYQKTPDLDRVLPKEYIDHIMDQVVGHTDYKLVSAEISPGTGGLTGGFLADCYRVVLHAKDREELRKVNLFVKRLPVDNKPQAEFIELNNFFRKEMLMLQLINEMNGAEGANPWGPKAFLTTETVIVMADLAVHGYSTHPLREPMDLAHVRLAAAALAGYHAAFANYDTKNNLEASRSFYEKHKHLLVEPTYEGTEWIRKAAKLTAIFLHTFSAKYSKAQVSDLEDKLAASLQRATQSLNVKENNFNVMLHKDLWNNNIMFKYDKVGAPSNSVLIDFQCVRYGPPAFDVMSLLYFTTSRNFRERHERDVLQYYWEVFSGSLQEHTRKRVATLRYDEKEFLSWCEKSRMFGVSEAVAMFPQSLMDAQAAKIFDFNVGSVEQDRLAAVLEYARNVPDYRQRLLEVFEEFVERYVV